MNIADGTASHDPLDAPVASIATTGVVGCLAEESLLEAARRMAEHRVHALVVEPREGSDQGFSVLSDQDLMEALGGMADPAEQQIGTAAATEPVTIAETETVLAAAHAMDQHQVSHLFVVDPGSGRPTGVVSTIDVARALYTRARERARGPRILLAHDAGPGGADAAALARLLTRAGGEVEAAVVVPFPPLEVGNPPLRIEEHAPTWNELCERLTEAGTAALDERVLPALEGVEASGDVVLDDSPAAALTELCDTRHPDLVVLGSSHRGPVGRVLLGTTAERLAHGSSCPTAIAPRGYADSAPDAIGSIAVGFDGGEESGRALEHAAALAARHSSSLKVIGVIEPRLGSLDVAGQAYAVLTAAGLHDRRGERLRDLVGQALSDRMGTLEVEIEVVDGDPKDELPAAAGGSDLLVLGSRGYGPLARVLLGSVSSYVVGHAQCPVLIVQRGLWRAR